MKTIKISTTLFILFILSSCLTAGLEDLPVYEEAEITNFKFEYRWAEKEGISDVLRVKPLNTELSINGDKQEVRCKIIVPPADAQRFTETVRNNVMIDNIVGYASISTAASIKPLGNAPVLGIPGDFSQQTMHYEVIAADQKTKKTWSLIIESFDK